ncbi:hypothetical protein ACWEDF_29875 [Micromonospora chersina]
MTGTPGEDGGSHAGDTDGGSPGASRGRNVEGGSAEGDRGRSGEGSRGGVPGPDWRERWERWLARARELWAVTWRGAERLWRAARPLLDQLRWQEAEPSAVTLVGRRAAPTLLVPAQGQVYHFVVRSSFTWTSHNARPELFGWYVDQFQPQALQRFRRVAVRCAADIPPDHPRAFMIALEGALAGDDALPWTYERGEVTFTCEPDVSVHLDESVRKLLQPYWEQRIALEWQRDLDRRRAEYEEEQRARRPADAPENDAEPTTSPPHNGAEPTTDMPDNGPTPTTGTPKNDTTPTTGTPDNRTTPTTGTPTAGTPKNDTTPTAGLPDNGPTPTTGTPDNRTTPTAGTQENGAASTPGMPEALRADHPPQQRKRQPEGGTAPRPDAPVERVAGPDPSPAPPSPRRPSGPETASPQSGETPSGDPDSPGPPEGGANN